MNLHSIATPSQTAWMWVRITGRNGHLLGTHAYLLAIGTPPAEINEYNWGHRVPELRPPAWFLPDRFQWRPFRDALNTHFSNGYIRPLCGNRSASRHPSAGLGASYDSHCPNCNTAATMRGIIIHTRNPFIDNLPIMQQLNREREAWRTGQVPF